MSTFLGSPSYLIPLGASVEDTKANIVATLTGLGWQVVASTVPYLNLLTGGTAPVTGQAYLFNGAYSQDSAGGNPGWVGVKLLAATQITAYALYPQFSHVTPGGSSTPKDWTLEYSDDGSAWTVADTRTNQLETNQRGGQDVRYYTVPGTPGAHQYWRLNFTSATHVSTAIALSQIRLYTANPNEWISGISSVFVIPPATEAIGNTYTRDLLQIQFTATTMAFVGIPELLQDMPQMIQFKEGTAGAVAATAYVPGGAPFDITASIVGSVLTVTAAAGVITTGTQIKGSGVYGNLMVASPGTGTGGPGTYNLNYSHTTLTSRAMTATAASSISGAVGAAGATAKDNLRSLYTNLKNSVDPVFSDITWWYSKPSAQNANDTADFIIGVMKTAAPNVYPSAANCTASTSGNYAKAGIYGYTSGCGVGGSDGAGLNATLDLVSGFILFAQITSRGIVFASKTNANYFGPIHAHWADHAKAVASLPTSPHPRGLSPIELVVGVDGLPTTLTSTAYPLKAIVMSALQDTTTPIYNADVGNGYHGHPHSGFVLRDQFTEAPNFFTYLSNTLNLGLAASGVWPATDAAGDDFQIHRMVMNGHTVANSTVRGVGGPAVIPAMDLQDWYKFRGTATSESLALVADSVTTTTTLAQVMDATTAYNAIALTSTAGMPTAGYVIIESEVIQYTGISGNNITGCTRARYGSTAQTHWNLDPVCLGLWFTIINGGALFCGYTKPA